MIRSLDIKMAEYVREMDILEIHFGSNLKMIVLIITESLDSQCVVPARSLREIKEELGIAVSQQ